MNYTPEHGDIFLVNDKSSGTPYRQQLGYSLNGNPFSVPSNQWYTAGDAITKGFAVAVADQVWANLINNDTVASVAATPDRIVMTNNIPANTPQTGTIAFMHSGVREERTYTSWVTKTYTITAAASPIAAADVQCAFPGNAVIARQGGIIEDVGMTEKTVGIALKDAVPGQQVEVMSYGMYEWPSANPVVFSSAEIGYTAYITPTVDPATPADQFTTDRNSVLQTGNQIIEIGIVIGQRKLFLDFEGDARGAQNLAQITADAGEGISNEGIPILVSMGDDGKLYLADKRKSVNTTMFAESPTITDVNSGATFSAITYPTTLTAEFTVVGGTDSGGGNVDLFIYFNATSKIAITNLTGSLNPTDTADEIATFITANSDSWFTAANVGAVVTITQVTAISQQRNHPVGFITSAETGFSVAGVIPYDTACVVQKAGAIPGFTALTPGKPVYLSDSGLHTQNPAIFSYYTDVATPVGFAQTATYCYVNIDFNTQTSDSNPIGSIIAMPGATPDYGWFPCITDAVGGLAVTGNTGSLAGFVNAVGSTTVTFPNELDGTYNFSSLYSIVKTTYGGNTVWVVSGSGTAGGNVYLNGAVYTVASGTSANEIAANIATALASPPTGYTVANPSSPSAYISVLNDETVSSPVLVLDVTGYSIALSTNTGGITGTTFQLPAINGGDPDFQIRYSDFYVANPPTAPLFRQETDWTAWGTLPPGCTGSAGVNINIPITTFGSDPLLQDLFVDIYVQKGGTVRKVQQDPIIYNTNKYGYQIQKITSSTIQVEFGDNGLAYYNNSSGQYVVIDYTWQYKILVYKTERYNKFYDYTADQKLAQLWSLKVIDYTASYLTQGVGYFDKGTSIPIATTRLNYNGNFYTTNFYITNGLQLGDTTAKSGTIKLYNAGVSTTFEVTAAGNVTNSGTLISTGNITGANLYTTTSVIQAITAGTTVDLFSTSTGTVGIAASASTVGIGAAATTFNLGKTTLTTATTNINTAASTAAKNINIGTNGNTGNTTTISIGTGLTGSASGIIDIGTTSLSTTTIYGNLYATSPRFTTSVTTNSTSFSLINTVATTVNAFGGANVALDIGANATAISIGNTTSGIQTVNMFTASTAASTYNFATGAVVGSTTKTLNIGTGGVASSITNITLGNTIGGTLIVNSPTLTISGTTLGALGLTSVNIATSVVGTATTISIGTAATTQGKIINIGTTSAAGTNTINLGTGYTGGTNVINIGTGLLTAATINIGTLSQSTINITGTFYIPTLYGSSSASGQLTLYSTSSVTKNTAGILMPDNITSTTTGTGTLVITGGLGITGNINSGGDLNLSGGVTITAGQVSVTYNSQNYTQDVTNLGLKVINGAAPGGTKQAASILFKPSTDALAAKIAFDSFNVFHFGGGTLADDSAHIKAFNITALGTLSVTDTITAKTTVNTINGIIINSGAVTMAGALSGVTTLGLSGAITGATTTNTINGIIINNGAISNVSTIGTTGLITAGTGLTVTSGVITFTVFTGGSSGVLKAASVDGVISGGATYLDVAASPTSHAANASTYGYGTDTLAGHLRSGTGLSITAGTIAVAYGASVGTSAQGNDSRLSDSRNPLSHTLLSHTVSVSAGKLLRSSNTDAFTWSTLTFPDTITTGQVLCGTGTNTVGAMAIPTSTLFLSCTAGGTLSWANPYTTLSHTHPASEVTSGTFATNSTYTFQNGLTITAGSLIIGTLSGVLKASNGTVVGGADYIDVSAAPTSHAANASTYGYGTDTLAGHLRVGTGLSITTGTIAVAYGSSAGTSAQGNDSRFHNYVTIGSLGAPTAKGISINDQNIALCAADGTFPGGVSTTAQTFAGDKTFTGNVTAPSFNATSLRAAKDDIEDAIIPATDLINSTKIVSYYLKADKKKTPKIGFIADDTNSLFASPDQNVMDMANCIGVLMKSVQELSQEIKLLRGRV